MSLTCLDFTILYRLLSRVVIIPFRGPSIQAKTREQQQAFSSLKRLKDVASCSIGYYIQLGKRYKEAGVFEVDRYEKRVGDLLPGCGGRTVKGYAHLMWFSEQVRAHS